MQDESLEPPLEREPPRRRGRLPQGRATRVLAIVGIALASIVAFAVIAFHVLTNTDWGRERVRRIIVAQLQKQATGGKVRIGRITGNLAKGITVHDFVITDRANQPFIAMDSLRARYRLWSLIRGRIDLDDVLLAQPTIVLDKPPGGEWNWKRIFPGDTLPAPADTTPGFGDWMRFTDVRVLDGHIVSRSPWRPSGNLTPAQRDSAARDVLRGSSRLHVVRVPTGYQKIVELRDLDATLPLVQLADPAVAARVVNVASMRVDAYPFRPPAAEIRDMRGVFHFTGDSLWWRGIRVRMPGSQMTGDGMYVLENGDMWIRSYARPLQNADFRWLYPRLPSRGGGPLDIDIIWKGATQYYNVRNADIRIDRQRVQGEIAIRLDDDITIRDSDLRVANLDTRTIEQVLGGFDIPRRGTIDARAKLRGNQTAMRVDADVAFHDAQGTGTSRVAAVGEVGYIDRPRTGILRARNLRVRLLPLRLELAQAFAPGLPIGGTLTGNAVVDGRSDTGVRVNGSLAHVDRGATSRVAGQASVRIAGKTFIDADVRLDPLAMATVAQFVKDAPTEGVLTGPVRFRGTLDDFTVRGELAHRAEGVVSQVAGTAAIRRSPELFIDADVRLDPLAMSTVARFVPEAPADGTLRGPVRFRGTLRDFTVTGDVAHVQDGFTSRVDGTATIRRRAEMFVDADVNLRPLALGTIAGFAPSLGLRGVVSGPLRFRGTLDDFDARGSLAVAGGGSIVGGGRVRLTGRQPGYDVDVRLADFNANALSTRAPEMDITGRVVAEGTGAEPATMNGTVAFNLDRSSFEGAAIDSAVGRVRLADGLARVERLQVRGEGLVADAQGAFGLRRGRSGTLTFSVAAPSIAPFAKHVPGATAEGATPPRPAVFAERMRAARADSARVARATEVERAISGRPAPRLVVDTPRAIPRNVTRGSLFAAGTLRGNIHDFDAEGRVAAQDLVLRGHQAGQLRGEFTWTDVRSSRGRLIANVQGRELVLAGFGFDSADARVAYTAPTGRVAVALWQNGTRDYALGGDITFRDGRSEVLARNVVLRFDTTLYTAPRPFAVRWGGPGVEVDNLELVSDEGGRIVADGRLPVEGNANLRFAVTGFEVGDVLALLQSDVNLRGTLTAEGTLRGTLGAPRFEGAAALAAPTLDGTRMPNLRGRFSYANRLLTTRLEAVQDAGVVVAVADASIPANLAFTGVTGERFPGEGLRVDVTADSLPLDMLPGLTDVVSDVSGRAAGRVSIQGSLSRPRIVGAVAVHNAAAKIEPLGIDVREISGFVRMAGDTVVIDSLVGRSGGPIRVRGGLGVGNFREPAFDLYFIADDAEVLDNDQGEVYASAGLALRGPWAQPYLSGQATIERGVINAPSGAQKRLISAGDPAIFAVLDTAVLSDRELLPAATSPLLRNLRADLDVAVRRDTWVRNRDVNLEIYTEAPVSVHIENEAVAVTGIVSTDRGEYELLSKRFEVSRGSALFIGAPDLNPTVQLTAQYEVRLPSRPAINVKILVGGTLKSPRITLESDAQPPLSQTDLLSFLAFGTESTSLVAIAGSALSAGNSGAQSVSGIPALATRRLFAVALGLAVEEAETEAGRALGVDVFNIRPADVPDAFGPGGLEQFLLGTEFEAGKYVNPQTFVAFEGVLPSRRTAAPPGIRLEHRAPKGFRFQVSYEPRFLLRDPSLTELQARKTTIIGVGSFGALLIREWRF